MRIGIIGSRHYNDKAAVLAFMSKVLDSVEVVPQMVCFVSGGARTGIDSIIREFCSVHKLPHVEYEPHFVVDKSAKYTPRDFFTRNRQIVNNCDMLIAYVDPSDTGTLHAVSYADKKDKAVFTIDLSLKGDVDEGRDS